MEKKEIVIIGAGRYSKALIEKLILIPRVSLIVIDKDPVNVESITGVKNIIIGDATNEEFLKGIGIENADYYIIGVGSDFQASLIIAAIIKENFKGAVIAKSVNQQHELILHKLGVEDVITPEIAAAKRTFAKIVNPLVRKGLGQFDMTEVSEEVSIAKIPVKPEWDKMAVKDLELPKDVAISLIYRKNKVHIVSGMTMLEVGDIIAVVGENKALIKFLEQFEEMQIIE